MRTVRGSEAQVVEAFVVWLEARAWTVEREVASCDVVARRDGEVLYAEAKGRTAAIGLDVDTLYGQLLRRAPVDAAGARFGVVVPAEARAAALRVPEATRRVLQITVFVVDDAGGVEAIDPPEPADKLLTDPGTDAFGVSLRLLGPHPEEVWGAIARTIAVGALIENRLVTLLQMLTGSDQDAYARCALDGIVKQLRKEPPSDNPAWAQWDEWLDRATRAAKWRNDLAHNVWPAQPGGRLFGWRLGRDGKLVLTNSTRDELMSRLSEAAAVAGESGRWVALAGAESGPRLGARRAREADAAERARHT